MRVLVAGPPKCGNVWVERLLSELYGLAILRPPDVPAGLPDALEAFIDAGRFPDASIFHQHFFASDDLFEVAEAAGVHIVAILRHPYDAFVSLYHYVQSFAEDFQSAGDPAATLIGAGLGDRAALRYLRGPFRGFLKMSASWAEAGSRATVVRYEDLHARPLRTLAGLTARIRPVSTNALHAALAAGRADRMRAEDPLMARHIRRATVGDSARHLGEPHLRVLRRRRNGRLIERVGYSTAGPPIPEAAAPEGNAGAGALKAVGYAYSASGSAEPGGPNAGVASQLATIRARCEARGWEIVALHDDPPALGPTRPGAAAALEAVRSGTAHVLVTTYLGTLADEPEDLARLIDESIGSGWGLVGADLGVDTTPSPGLVVARYAGHALAAGGPPAATPVPPPELIYLATGTGNGDWYDRTGRMAVTEVEHALGIAGRDLRDFRSILDFGCGAGRILRHLAAAPLPARLSGVDIQAPAVDWLAANLPGAAVSCNGHLPPLACEDAEFDLVIGYSVFTHLNERYQDVWLAELARVVAPGGLALLTTNGRHSWEWHADGPMAGLGDLESKTDELSRNGFLFWTGDGWESWFPDFYHSTWHLPDYIGRRWSRWFDVVSVLEGAAGPTQDLVVLRRPQRQTPGGRGR